jgi:lipopolysaccharide export system permease protein
MRISGTLSLYIARQFAIWVGGVFFSLLSIAEVFDLVELMRRSTSKVSADIGVLLSMTLFHMPELAQELIPFALLFGAMLAFYRLTRSHELVIARAAGISAWQFMLPALAMAAAIGMFQVMVFSPLSAVMLARYDSLESRYFEGRQSLLSVASNGLWLRQGDVENTAVIHAQRIAANEMLLSNVTIYMFEDEDRFVGRLDTNSAYLTPGYWVLGETWLSRPDQRPERFDSYRLKTDLTTERIQDSFAPPETMSFWELPGFIAVLDAAGFSAHRHRLYWHNLLATPVLLGAMVLVAATLSLRPTRRGGTMYLIAAGVLIGFLLYMMSDVVFALGLSASIPVELAAWTPAGVSALVGVSMVLHLEDG